MITDPNTGAAGTDEQAEEILDEILSGDGGSDTELGGDDTPDDTSFAGDDPDGLGDDD